MAITYSAQVGTTITSPVVIVASLATQTGGNNQIQIPATAGSTLPSTADDYTSEIGNGTNGLGDTYVGRICMLRKGTGTQEIRIIESATYATDVVTITVTEDWASNPVATDAFDICHEPGDIEDGGSGGGINLNSKTGLYELSNTLTIANTGFLQIANGNALELTDDGANISFIIQSGGWFIAGLSASGAEISGGITPSYNNTTGEPSTQIQSGGNAYYFDTLIWAQLVAQQFECADGSNGNFSRVKWLNMSDELHLYDATVNDCSVSGKTSTTDIVRVDAGTTTDIMVFSNIDTVDSVANTTTETIELKNVLFTNVTDYINIRDNKTWDIINPTWGVTAHGDFVWVGTTLNVVNERYSLELEVAEPDGTAIASPRAFVYRGLLDAVATPALDVDITGTAGGIVDTNWIYRKYETNSNTDTYTDHALRIFKYGYTPFVATLADNEAKISGITLIDDTDITEATAATAITNGSGIIVTRHATGETDTRPMKVLNYDTGTGTVPTVGETMTSGTSTGVVVEYIGDAISGTLVLETWNGTEFTDNTLITGGTSSFSATTDLIGGTSFYEEYTWLVDCNALALTVVYDYLAAKMEQATLDAIFDKAHEWGADEQGQLMYLGGSGHYTERNITKTEGVWLSDRGTGTIAYMTADDGTAYTPPASYTINITGIRTGSEVRLITDDANRDFIDGIESTSGTVKKVTIIGGGTGYTVSDVLTVVGGTGTAATLTVTSVDAGEITGVDITTAGSYTIDPTNPASVTGGTGTGATFNLAINGSFSYTYTYTTDIPFYIVVFHLSFKEVRLTDLTITNSDQSFLVQQITDRTYSNP